MRLLYAGITPPGYSGGEEDCHTYAEILFYLKGNGVLRIEQDEYPFVPGTLVFQPAGRRHVEYAGEYVNIHLQVMDIPCDRSIWISPLDEDVAFLEQLAMKIHAHYHSRQDSRRALILSRELELLWTYLVATENRVYDLPCLHHVEQSIITHFADPQFQLRDVLDSQPFSGDHFCRIFKKRFGLTPHQYLIEKRMEAAKSLLLHLRDIPVKDVGLMAGFEDPYYFSRLFKKCVGCSPSEFREEQRQDGTLPIPLGICQRADFDHLYPHVDVS